jgi:hypothetical protein
MTSAQALDIARTMLAEISNNLERHQRQLGTQADNKYFDREQEKLFKIQTSLNKLEI